MNYIFDTNTVIYYLQKQFPEKARDFVNNLLAKRIPYLSVITEIELLCWKDGSEEDMKTLKNFIKLPDAIIAATAIVKGYTLVTRNTVDFKNISDLILQNPWEQ